MWYVIHTKTGYEHDLVDLLKKILDRGLYSDFLIPLYEDVKRSNDVSKITYRRLFPGYVFIKTDKPGEVRDGLHSIPHYTRLLGMIDVCSDVDTAEEMYDKKFESVSQEDMDFLDSILDDGVMTVSYVEHVKGRQIKRIIGPLAAYGNHIRTIEFRKRWAIVEAEVFGKRRKIKFGLWTNNDPKIPWIEDRKNANETTNYLLKDMDIGLKVGDIVTDTTGMYEDQTFIVESINPIKRVLTTRIPLLGDLRRIELYVDNVTKV